MKPRPSRRTWLALISWVAAGMGCVPGALADLVAPELQSALATPSFLLQLGEPAMILWLLLGRATRARARDGSRRPG